MTTYKQGDIILVWFPDSNLMTAKKRPAVVLQSNNLQTGLGQLIIGMITSNLIRNKEFLGKKIKPNVKQYKCINGVLNGTWIWTGEFC